MRILLVEDDQTIVEVVTAVLSEQHYVVDVATDGEAGWELAEAFPYDLVLLDIVLPKLDGIAFCRRLRSQKNQVLVMLLTARDTTTDKLIGLDAGADDYVVKPFNVQELAARIRALLRRGNTLTTSILSCGKLSLDPGACEVTYDEKLLRFSRKEYLLLELFLRQQNRVFSRSAIVDQIWSFSEDPPNEDTVKSHIKSIRRKLDAVGVGDLIETLYGQGYRINPAYSSLPQPTAALPQLALEPQQQALDLSVAEIWQRTKSMSMQRIRVLEQVAEALKTNRLDRRMQQQGVENAHKLAGSLGTFGYEEGSNLAHQLENLLQSSPGTPTSAEQKYLASQVEPLLSALQAELGKPSTQTLVGSNLQPAATPQLTLNQPPAYLVPQQPVDSPLLLIIESDRHFAQAIVAQAAKSALRSLTATTLEAAQKHCQRERPHAVVMDLALLQTVKRGHGLIESLRNQPSVPIIFLSAEAGSQERLEAMQAGGHLFLKKPTSPTSILKAAVRLLHLHETTPLKVMVVDDDPLIAATLATCLEPQGIQLTGLADPTQFWETLNVVVPHLLILDVNMPSVSGIELCQTVRNDPEWDWLPILFLTAQPDLKTHQQIFQIGADDLMMKPIVPSEVSTRVLNRLRRSQIRQN